MCTAIVHVSSHPYNILPGHICGRLTVLGSVRIAHPSGSDRFYLHYWCACACGLHAFPVRAQIVHARTKSCGCLKPIIASNLWRKHGMYRTRIYRIWQHMVSRCTSEKNDSWKDYGGRGITVCERWLDFRNFLKDMGPTYQKNLSIDRIDNDRGYCPENCRWSTCGEQLVNRRNNILLTHDGKTQALSLWAKELGIPDRTLRSRIMHSGWPVEQALTIPIGHYVGRFNQRSRNHLLSR